MVEVRCTHCGKIGYSAFHNIQCTCGETCTPSNEKTATKECESEARAILREFFGFLIKKAEKKRLQFNTFKNPA